MFINLCSLLLRSIATIIFILIFYLTVINERREQSPIVTLNRHSNLIRKLWYTDNRLIINNKLEF